MCSVIVMQVANEMALSRRRLNEILRIESLLIVGILLLMSRTRQRGRLLPYIEEALKIEKGRKLFEISLVGWK
jgi:hypothetical protein